MARTRGSINSTRPGRVEYLSLPGGTTFLTPLAGEKAAALHDGRMSVIGLTTGLTESVVDAPPQSTWFVVSAN